MCCFLLMGRKVNKIIRKNIRNEVRRRNNDPVTVRKPAASLRPRTALDTECVFDLLDASCVHESAETPLFLDTECVFPQLRAFCVQQSQAMSSCRRRCHAATARPTVALNIGSCSIGAGMIVKLLECQQCFEIIDLSIIGCQTDMNVFWL